MPKKIILTGDRPTGRLHIGHYVGTLANRVKLQDEYKQFVMIADVQALTDNFETPDKIRKNIFEVTLDYLAAGIDPDKTAILIQSMIPEISELTIYFLNLVSLARLERNPTVKLEMKQKGFGANVPVGFLAYPVSQAADILAFKADLVPVGDDQLPMIEQTNEIAERFNRIYGKIFNRVKALIPKEGSRLPGIDGKAKMGKSLNNAIYLSDSKKDLKRKVMSMYTDPGHIHVKDPGRVEGNAVFNYLDIFDKNQKELRELKAHYKKGGLGDVVLKERLFNILEEFLAPIRERRKEFAGCPEKIKEILKAGTEEARKVAKQTLFEVKKTMKINYIN